MPLKSDIKIGIEIEFIYEGGKKHKKQIQTYLRDNFSNVLLYNNRNYITCEYSIIHEKKLCSGEIQTIPLQYNINTLNIIKKILYALYVELKCFTNNTCAIHLHISSKSLDYYELGCLLYNFIDNKHYNRFKKLKLQNKQTVLMQNVEYSNISNMKRKYYYEVLNKIKSNNQDPFEIIKFQKNSFCQLRQQFETIEYRAIRGIFDIKNLSEEEIKRRIFKYVLHIDNIISMFCKTNYNKIKTYDIYDYKEKMRHMC